MKEETRMGLFLVWTRQAAAGEINGLVWFNRAFHPLEPH